jgi:hypothetical protein
MIPEITIVVTVTADNSDTYAGHYGLDPTKVPQLSISEFTK